jgi:hypothetical protein
MHAFLPALLLLPLLLVSAEATPPTITADPVAWAVVLTTDPSGTQSVTLVGLSQAGASAPEIKALQQNAAEVWTAAKQAWDERRKAYEADRANGGRSFRRTEPEPAKPVVKVIGSPLKDKSAAEDLLAKASRDMLAKSDPGAARRAAVMSEQLLPYFTIGIQATPEWIIETREAQGDRWACMAGYLSHVVDTPGDVEGKDTWFFKYGGLRAKFEGARAAKVICWNTWYGLAEAPPARYKPTPAAATPVNAKVQSTMIAYWSLAKKFLLMAKEFEDVDCVMQIEPDEWGHLLLSCGFDGNKEGVVLVGGSGMPELRGIPDTVKGYAYAFRVLRDLYAPHVLLAANPSAWDRNGTMSGERWGKYFNALEVNQKNGWDLFITQLHDWDAGQVRNGSRAVYPPYTEANTITYHGSVDAWCAWIKPIHEATGMWGVAWQLPLGNATYATCDGSDGHGMDGVAELLLDNHPANRVAARMATAGCCMWIFSLGGDGSNVFDAKKDGVTNPTPHAGSKGLKSIFPDDDGGYLRLMGAEYFKHPVPILARPAAAKAAKATKGKPIPDPLPAKAVPQLQDKTLAGTWNARLHSTVQAELHAHRELRFKLSALRAEVTLRDLRPDGTVVVAIAGGGEMSLQWTQLDTRDLAALAVSLSAAHRDDADVQALAAFHLLLAGDEAAARECLSAAGTAAAEVERAFGLHAD